jgi:hypothetical protein
VVAIQQSPAQIPGLGVGGIVLRGQLQLPLGLRVVLVLEGHLPQLVVDVGVVRIQLRGGLVLAACALAISRHRLGRRQRGACLREIRFVAHQLLQLRDGLGVMARRAGELRFAKPPVGIAGDALE